MSPERIFSATEYAGRTHRCQVRLAERELGAILMCTELDVRYLAQPWFTGIPATGKPMAIVPSVGGTPMSATCTDDGPKLISGRATPELPIIR